jgi:hypothetical protein
MILPKLKEKGPHYYGSDLNRFIDEKCSHEMYCINIDCVLVKVTKGRIRFIESKHTNESFPKSEKSVYGILKHLLSEVKTDWKIEFFIVAGEYPFETAEVSQFGNAEVFTLNQKQLIKWLNFEEELNHKNDVKNYDGVL